MVKAGGAIALADQKLQVVVATSWEKFEPCCFDHPVAGLQVVMGDDVEMIVGAEVDPHLEWND